MLQTLGHYTNRKHAYEKAQDISLEREASTIGTHFICLHRKLSDGSYTVPLISQGFSSMRPVGVLASVGRNLMTTPCPPTAREYG